MATRVALALLICSLANAASAAVPSVGPGHEGVRLELIADGFGVLSNGAAPGGERDLVYLLEQHEGRVVLVENGSVAGRPVLELAGQLIEDTWNEEGLVGVALPPDDPSTLFVSYVDRSDHLVVSRFRLLDDGRRADPDSETVLLRVPREARIHHCGHLEFGPHDGRLYLCIGDMQSNEGEITSVSQDTARVQGKIVRLDPWIEAQVANRESTLVRSADAAPYGLAEPEVWLHGLRNPWRFGFDLDAGLAFIPDVGRYHFEELNVVPLDQEAGNFGWPLAEAGECLVDCTAHDDLIWPILEYSQQDDRCAIMGGTTYRGAASPAWRRVYLFGDFCGGKIWALRDPGGHPELRLLIDSELTPVGFIRDHRGEILVVDGPQGALWRLRLPEDLGTGWRPAADVTAEMALATRRMGFSRTRALLEQARTDLFYMRASLRWRLTEPRVQLYNALGRPLN